MSWNFYNLLEIKRNLKEEVKEWNRTITEERPEHVQKGNKPKTKRTSKTVELLRT
jgi:hypothetical protein